jgi:L-ribulose-5-phosphate 3-epimerase
MQRLGIYEKAYPDSLTWDERLMEAAKAGFDFVEMSIDDSDERLSRLDWPSSTRMALRRSMDNAGIPIQTMGLSGHRKFPMGSNSPQIRQKSLEILNRTIELAYDLGIRVIQLMGYDVFSEVSNAGTQERFLEGLKQGAQWASAANVMLALENVDVDTINSVEKALRFVREVNSPWLNLYPDMGNLVAAGYDPLEQLKIGREYLVGMHVKDALPGKVRGVTFEKGCVAFNDVFQLLGELNYSGPFVVEMWAHLDSSGDPARAAAEACRLVRRLINSPEGNN